MQKIRHQKRNVFRSFVPKIFYSSLVFDIKIPIIKTDPKLIDQQVFWQSYVCAPTQTPCQKTCWSRKFFCKIYKTTYYLVIGALCYRLNMVGPFEKIPIQSICIFILVHPKKIPVGPGSGFLSGFQFLYFWWSYRKKFYVGKFLLSYWFICT